MDAPGHDRQPFDLFDPIPLDALLLTLAIAASAKCHRINPDRVFEGGRFGRPLVAAAEALGQACRQPPLTLHRVLQVSPERLAFARAQRKATFLAAARSAYVDISTELKRRDRVPGPWTPPGGRFAPRVAAALLSPPPRRGPANPWERPDPAQHHALAELYNGHALADPDAAFVADRRRAGVSWAHIGRQLGRPAQALRAAYADLLGEASA